MKQIKINKNYWRFYCDALDQLFNMAEEMEWSNQQLADKSKLHVSTIYRLLNRRSVYPRLETLFKLGKSLNTQIILSKNKISTKFVGKVKIKPLSHHR